ncbi:bifunctional glycosyl transferase/transpeptidase [Buchnera aphidicola (Rhopalosiphum padi)]|uniref:Penicillin-binding protein 1B n=1 Tax=Buchnera aphidicola subsp. Rhopalosiphum padi TaxID=98793 RepID=A0A4D6Y654_BUCRP|nr:bifunctional glycosyl transferase/transpeptidase [Buchnera aphidicola]QCI24852.1 bifunctional glycosyl transferase/transpeptidase [Buchnera aphidicola (Rhopalosiphum padi)]
MYLNKRKIKLLGNFFFLILVLVFFYGFFLYMKIGRLIDGKVWHFPTSIYGRIINLEPGNLYSQKEVSKFLQGTMYREVDTVMLPGEYSIKNNNIEFIRRSFDFPDLRENEFHVKLFFDNNYLLKIQNLENNRNFSFFRLEPKLIAMLESPEGKKRVFIPRSKYPELLIKTLLAIEDRYFYEHDGINISSIGRAFLVNIMAGRTVQGGSTLTQQLVKNLFLTNTRSIWRKINEMYMALILDWFYKKDRILELYLNEVYLGQDGKEQIRGFPLASLYYFGRPIDELNLDQYALLVGMVKGASLYNPWSNPDFALNRRNLVLLSLYNQGYIQEKIYTELSARPLNIKARGCVISSYPNFTQLVQMEIKEKLQNKIKNLSGIKVFTTLDIFSQNAIEKAVKIGIPILKKKKKLKDLEIAMIVVDRFTGEIQALVGGSNPKFYGYNRALQARRSIGSLSKPITYLTALSNPKKYRLNTWISDHPIAIKLKNGKFWIPKNNNYHFSGQVMLIDALTNSINIPTVNLSIDMGLENLVKSWFHLGISKKLITPFPSISLGAINLTPIEIAQVFQVIASGGYKTLLSSVRSIISDDGKVLYQSLPQSKNIESIEATYLTLYGMQEVVSCGTAKSLGSIFKKFSLAGKTGTTNNLVDNWFVGIDGRQIVITWIGRDNNKSTKLYSSSGAMQIYRRYLEYQRPTPLILKPPKNINIFYMNKLGRLFCERSNEHKKPLPIWLLNDENICGK